MDRHFRLGYSHSMIALALLLATVVTGKAEDATRDVVKGAALYKSCQAEVRLIDLPDISQATQPDLIDGSFCVGFVNGFTGNLSGAKIGICTNGASMGVVVKAYVAFMDKNPKLMDEDRRVGLGMALQSAYPCPAAGEPKVKHPSSTDPQSTWAAPVGPSGTAVVESRS